MADGTDPPELSALRAQVQAVDAQIVALVAERQALAATIGACKRALDLPLRDRDREAQVHTQARRVARAHGLPVEVAEAVMRVLIGAAHAAQEPEAAIPAREP